MSPTKLLTINPEFFSSKNNHSKTLKKERKQKPVQTKTTSSMRKALLAKIRDYQKKEGEKINEKYNEKVEEKDETFENEFNKSLNFLQQIANKHKEKKKNKTFKQNKVKNTNDQLVNIELPEAFIDIPHKTNEERNSIENNTEIKPEFNNKVQVENINSNNSNIILDKINTQNTIIDDTVNFKPLIKNTIQNNITSNIIEPFIQETEPTPIINHHNQSQHKQNVPFEIKINTTELTKNTQNTGIKINENKIKQNNVVQHLKEKIKLNVKNSLDNNKIRPKLHFINTHNSTIKTPPLYSNLKGGTRPTYRELNKTYKNHIIQPKLTINENKNIKNTIPSRKKITRKIKTIKYNLGKKGRNISVLIKNNNTRKKIKQELSILRKKPILEIKEYLYDKNLIKLGTLAPNDVLREIYQQSILSGDLINENKDNLIHNFLNNKEAAF
jgi:hypothetical protein